MSGDTHAAVGIAVGSLALSVAPPAISGTVTGIAITLVASIIGALFPDLDLANSKGSLMLNKALKFIVPVLVLGFLGIRFGLIKRQRVGFSTVSLVAFCIFLLVGFFARTRPHREFTHSLLVLFGTTILIGLAFGSSVGVWYALGYASHLGIDLLNNKGESLLWPSKFKLCFKLCTARGTANSIIKVASCIVALATLLTLKVGGI